LITSPETDRYNQFTAQRKEKKLGRGHVGIAWDVAIGTAKGSPPAQGCITEELPPALAPGSAPHFPSRRSHNIL
jgi:hypothetical protein